MEGNETTNASELIPGREYQLGVIDCHAQVFYNQQTWVVVYSSHKIAFSFKLDKLFGSKQEYRTIDENIEQ